MKAFGLKELKFHKGVVVVRTNENAYGISFIILCMYIISSLVPGCDNSTLVANGFCDDETNNAECNYDGGECCVVNANTDYCSDCACHMLEICTAGYHPLVGNGICDNETNNFECSYDGGDCCLNTDIVGNGFCNDETNHPGCNYDGGDCCVNGNSVNTDHCSDCHCLGGGVITSPGFPENYDIDLDLTWLIQVQIGQTMEINFLSFDLEEHPYCK